MAVNLRTNPTVKPLATMNKSIHQFEIKLGSLQVMILLGLITGFMCLSYFFGFYTGERAGYSLAYDPQKTSMVRLPAQGIAADTQAVPEPAKEATQRTFVKDHVKTGTAETLELPKLAMIESVAREPIPKKGDQQVVQNAKQEVEPEIDLAKVDDLNPNQVKSAPVLKVLGGDVADTEINKEQDQQTLGSLLEKHTSKTEAKEDLKQLEDSGPNLAESTKQKTTKAVSAIEATTQSQVGAEKNQKTKLAENERRSSEALPRGWFAQVAAPRKIQEAKQVTKKLNHAGFRTVIENAHIKGEEYYRVLVGPEESKLQAERLIQQLKRESLGGGDPFLRQVK